MCLHSDCDFSWSLSLSLLPFPVALGALSSRSLSREAAAVAAQAEERSGDATNRQEIREEIEEQEAMNVAGEGCS